MEKTVENWLNANSGWFETYAMENLNMKLVEKWLKINQKTICKCHEQPASAQTRQLDLVKSINSIGNYNNNNNNNNNNHVASSNTIQIKL